MLPIDSTDGRAPATAYAPPPTAEPPSGADDGPTPVVVDRAIPAVVSAAWELELLIAGAVTFALFQLPGSLDAALAAAEPRLAGKAAFVAFMGYVYTKAIVYVLLAAFLLNLVARAYWVGLVGLHSVFPHGVRWDRLGSTAGPFTIAEYERRLSSLPRVIARVDNFASVIFSFAFLVVLTVVLSVASVAVIGAAAYGLSVALFDGAHVWRIVIALGALIVAPMILVGLFDRYFGQRLAPDGRGARVLARAVRATVRFSGAPLFGPIYMTLFTNLKKRTMIGLLYAAMFGGLAVGMWDFVDRTLGVSAGGSRYVPDDLDVRGVNGDHYESLRTADASTTVPTIQSDVVTGPYVRLFVPFRPERHDPWLAANCPGAGPLRNTRVHIQRSTGQGGARLDSLAGRALGCLARLHAVTLDGVARPDLAFHFYAHPTTGRDGMIAYLPTAPLAPGMHTLTVLPAPRASRPAAPREPMTIRFWR